MGAKIYDRHKKEKSINYCRTLLLAPELNQRLRKGSLPGNSKTAFEERTGLLLFREGSLTKCMTVPDIYIQMETINCLWNWLKQNKTSLGDGVKIYNKDNQNLNANVFITRER